MESHLQSTNSHPLLTEEQFQSLSLHTSAWRFENWLANFPLNKSTVIDYFKHSNFYDSSCNNELAAVQSMNDENQNYDFNTILTSMTGIEYVLDHRSTDELFLIRKQYRHSPARVDLIALYYVIGIDAKTATDPQKGTIFPIPNLDSFFKCNINSLSYYLSNAISEISKGLTLTSNENYKWKFAIEEDDFEQLLKMKKLNQQNMFDSKTSQSELHEIDAALQIFYENTMGNQT